MAGKNIANARAVPVWRAGFLHNFLTGAFVHQREE